MPDNITAFSGDKKIRILRGSIRPLESMAN